jgi:SOS-response transcriptional repressor LexA
VRDDLTDRQLSILACIRDRIAESGEAPTVREIGRKVGLSSTSSVVHHLVMMEEAGVISRGPGPRDCRPTSGAEEARSVRPRV